MYILRAVDRGDGGYYWPRALPLRTPERKENVQIWGYRFDLVSGMMTMVTTMVMLMMIMMMLVVVNHNDGDERLEF